MAALSTTRVRVLVSGKIVFLSRNLGGLKIGRRCLSNAAPRSDRKESRRNGDPKTQISLTIEDVVIPKKINRSPTDILKALASTVSTDYTAAHYKYHDDPYLIPYSNTSKRSYALAKESGRKAARWLCDTYPKYFLPDTAEPHIEAFMPQPQFNAETDITLDNLKKCLEEAKVSFAVEIYKGLIAKGVSVNDELKLNLLELTCYYNCEDTIPSEFIEEKWFKRKPMGVRRKTWQTRGFAEELFHSLEIKDAPSYCAIIRGMAKYFQVDEAYALYREMQEKNLFADVKTYNALIPMSTYLRENAESRWQVCKEFLQNMRRELVHPDLGTFNAVLEVLSRLGYWSEAKKLSLHTLGEMSHMGVEPSLGSYYYVLNTLCKEKGPVSTILYDIMDKIEGKEFSIRHPQDGHFFVAAMNVCYSHLLDRDLALRVHAFLHYNDNYLLLGDSMREAVYYQNFFKVMCVTDDIETLFESYNKLVPNVYTPEPSVILEILDTIEIHQSWKYVPVMWTDIIAFDQFARDILLTKILQIVGTHKPKEETLQTQFGDIAWDIEEKIAAQNPEKIRDIKCWTGEMLSNAMQACLNARQDNRAWHFLQKLIKDVAGKITGHIRGDVLLNFLKTSVEAQATDKCVAMLRYAVDSGLPEAAQIGEIILTRLPLSEIDRSKVQHVLGSQEGNQTEPKATEESPTIGAEK